jgi:peptidoglycan/xylan/chitin deacetylase (PgdA/CDA1 family)
MMATGRARLIQRVATGLDWAGLLRPVSRAAGYARKASAFPILAYHRVNDERDPFFPSLPTAVFERHMEFIVRAYLVLPLEELVERMRRSVVPRNALAITLDDGYRDNLTHAAPVLARYGLPATVFLATGFIGSAEVPWFDRVALAFKTSRATTYRAPWGAAVRLESRDDRLSALGGMLAYLKRRADDEMRRAVDELLAALEVSDQRPFKNWMLSWDDVHALAGLGFGIGAHTVSHPILSRVSTERAWAEITGSRSMIASACGFAPRTFAYPNGKPADYTEAVARLVREAGFTCAVTTRFGVNTAATPPYELRRGGPWEHHLPTFALKLAAYRLTGA